MLLSTALRLGSGLLVFVVVARQLGAVDFGTLMTGFAAAGILAVPVNYGLGLFLLKEASLSPDRGAGLFSQALCLKGLLLIPVVLLVLPVSSILSLRADVLALLVAMHVAEGCTELVCVRLRALGHYDRETRFVTVQALLQLGLIALVAWLVPSVGWVAAAFLASRLLTLALALTQFRETRSIRSGFSLHGAVLLARRAVPFCLDFSAQNVLVQIDAVLLGILAGPGAVGTYQAGMRLAHGLSQLITVVVNVALPRLTRMPPERLRSRDLCARVMAGFAMLGLLVAIPIIVWADSVAPALFGAAFHGLAPVIQVLGIFLIVRFAAAGVGMLLIANGTQSLRASVMALATLVLAALGWLLMPQYGALGAAWAVTGAYGFILIAFSTLVFVSVPRRAAIP